MLQRRRLVRLWPAFFVEIGFMFDAPSIELLLASQSPRRRELITLLGYPVRCLAAEADEESIQTPDPAINVVETAVLKANLITQSFMPASGVHTILVAADTTVAVDGQMLNKPGDAVEARHMLQLLRGRTHEVYSGFVIRNLLSGEEQQGVHTAVVIMRPYTDAEIEAYVATGDPLDKAGAYAIQHPGFRPVGELHGCFLSVMGFPLCDLLWTLRQMGIPGREDKSAIYQAHQQYFCPVFQQHFA